VFGYELSGVPKSGLAKLAEIEAFSHEKQMRFEGKAPKRLEGQVGVQSLPCFLHNGLAECACPPPVHAQDMLLMRSLVATADETRDGNFQDVVAGLMPVWCKRAGPLGKPGPSVVAVSECAVCCVDGLYLMLAQATSFGCAPNTRSC
jgi:hypothetical protein